MTELIRSKESPLSASTATGDILMQQLKSAIVGMSSITPQNGTSVSRTINVIWSAFLDNLFKDSFINQWYLDNLLAATGDLNNYNLTSIKAPMKATRNLMNTFATNVEFQLMENTPQSRQKVRTSFTALETKLRMNLANIFRHSSSDLAELPTFAFSSTIYFMVQTQFQRYATAWGFDNNAIVTQRTNVRNSLANFSNHTRATFEAMSNKIVNTPRTEIIFDELDAQHKLESVLLLRLALIPTVFDYVAMWWRMDLSTFPSGTYGEQVRLLFSKISGNVVDPSTSTTPSGFDYAGTYQRMEELFSGAKFEHYRGQVTQIQFCFSNQGVISVTRSLKLSNKTTVTVTPRSPTDTVSSVQSVIISPTIKDQGINLGHVEVPLFIGLEIHVGYMYAVGVVGQTYLHQAEYPLQNFNISVPGHKISDLFPWSKTRDILMDYKIVDAIQGALIPSEVFPENVVLARVSTMINAQKYHEISGNVTFAKDHHTIGSHSMRMEPSSRIRYYFEANGVVVETYTIGIFAKTTGAASTVRIYNQVNRVKTLLTTVNIPASTDYTAYNDLMALIDVKKDPYTNLEYLTIEPSAEIFLNAIILNPISL
ncbi:hypothetical protein SAMD00019534_033040 [Acytostelium subglobosum LB1]|uniref:hypothetical protein n=1 Tax=Acytostelium subglobosum LB1 TaxID=1410327 RepID=UPI000644E45B|nr:hypothetical protein SAMD00019534_033040 [Acytostelium subglobosum LB1]GAM20129.1 hypothetical protein SAMD00019534_033040 [Acytostelium subglobosum LB1]|eukprot:XP_012756891.1 hypothetical protein SAMD00019534_033040 [Acytostelium subglobosum LB1]